MTLFVPAPKPKTALGYYRLLSPNAGIRVSPIQLGGMSVGDKWQMGDMNKESSFKLLDAYFDNGGNFIDTANSYHDESSEQFIGEWAEARGNRDQLVLCTKYTFNFKARDDSISQKILYTGNSAKTLHISVNLSLKNLRTSYIDILYLHFWNWDASIEEVMRSLHTMVLQGKVLYLGISDTPAWIVSKANQYARDHGMTPFVIYQGAWNVMDRSFEREIIPMARAEGMAISPWNVLAGGKIRTDEEEEKRRKTGENGRAFGVPGTQWERNEKEKKMSKALEKVAGEVGAKHITAVAIAYVMQKTPYVFPIIGGRKVEHMMANIEALEISLSDDQIKYLEGIEPFDQGFPHWMVGNGQEEAPIFDGSNTAVRGPFVQPLRPLK